MQFPTKKVTHCHGLKEMSGMNANKQLQKHYHLGGPLKVR